LQKSRLLCSVAGVMGVADSVAGVLGVADSVTCPKTKSKTMTVWVMDPRVSDFDTDY
jgi:hypothetical protein